MSQAIKEAEVTLGSGQHYLNLVRQFRKENKFEAANDLVNEVREKCEQLPESREKGEFMV